MNTTMTMEKVHLERGGELWYAPSFLNPNEAQRLFASLHAGTEWEQHSMNGRDVPRLVKWFGSHGYSYSGIYHDPLALPRILEVLREKVETAVFGFSRTQFQGVLLNLYRNGNDSVGFHADNEPEILKDSPIASISLGAVRKFVVKPRRGRNKNGRGENHVFHLPSGSLIVMAGTTQRHYLHGVPKQKSIADPRINLTFRQYNFN